MKTRIAGALANTALLLASCLTGLLLCEAGLRLFHPEYAPLAEAPLVHDPNLLFIRLPNHCSLFGNPDTHRPHSLCHNNLGLRQHRNFSAADLESSINLGFFGDSFTENIGMEAQFSFTEPLDYLLNLGGEGAFNALNFGVQRYGLAQSLLRYELWDFREALDHVFYVHFENDLRDDLASGLFRLDDAGQLARREAAPSRFALLSKLHLSYLALDAAGRLSTHFGEIAAKAKRLEHEFDQRRLFLSSGVPQRGYALFRQLLRRFKEAVEGNGASFHLVWLPMENHASSGVAAIVREEGVDAFSLRDCFGERDPAHLRTPWPASPYRFENDRDRHWNEAGNRLAAVCLHRFLAGRLGLPSLSEEAVAQALRRYYSAFEAPGSARGLPLAGKAQPASPTTAAIRRKYGVLEGNLPSWRPPWAPSPDKLALRTRFDVYLHDGWLAYVKEGCASADFDRRFFLHAWPVDVRDLPPERRAHGFDNLDVGHRIDEAACTAWRKLPSYAIERIRFGQFSYYGHGDYETHWEAEHVLAQAGAGHAIGS